MCNHRKAHDNLLEFYARIARAVPRPAKLNVLSIALTSQKAPPNPLQVSSEPTPTTYDKILKLHIFPLLKVILIVDQFVGPVEMPIC